jgi:hypothetical protein
MVNKPVMLRVDHLPGGASSSPSRARHRRTRTAP